MKLADEYFHKGELEKARDAYQDVIKKKIALNHIYENYLISDHAKFTEMIDFFHSTIKTYERVLNLTTPYFTTSPSKEIDFFYLNINVIFNKMNEKITEKLIFLDEPNDQTFHGEKYFPKTNLLTMRYICIFLR